MIETAFTETDAYLYPRIDDLERHGSLKHYVPSVDMLLHRNEIKTRQICQNRVWYLRV